MMSQENITFETLEADYFEQWDWFLRNNNGHCLALRSPERDNERLQDEFEERKNDFFALIDQIEATPLTYYFCWAEAVIDEDNEEYYLDSDSFACVKVEELTKQQAESILRVAAYELRDEILDYHPDYSGFSGKYVPMAISELDFILLHTYSRDKFFPKHLAVLFPPPRFSPMDSVVNQDIRNDLNNWKKESLRFLSMNSGTHAIRLEKLSSDGSSGDRFLTNVLKCTKSPTFIEADDNNNEQQKHDVRLQKVSGDKEMGVSAATEKRCQNHPREYPQEVKDAALKIAKKYLEDHPDSPNTEIAEHVATHKDLEWFQSFHLTKWGKESFGRGNRKKAD